MLDQQITSLMMCASCYPLITPPPPLSLSYQGDAGETGEPGLQGEVGPPVSFLTTVHRISTENQRTNTNFTNEELLNYHL